MKREDFREKCFMHITWYITMCRKITQKNWTSIFYIFPLTVFMINLVAWKHMNYFWTFLETTLLVLIIWKQEIIRQKCSSQSNTCLKSVIKILDLHFFYVFLGISCLIPCFDAVCLFVCLFVVVVAVFIFYLN